MSTSATAKCFAARRTRGWLWAARHSAFISEEKTGICGALYVRAGGVLEKGEKDDRNGLSAALAEKLKVLFAGLRSAPGVWARCKGFRNDAAVTVERDAGRKTRTVCLKRCSACSCMRAEKDDHARLFDAVCAAVSSLPCALRSVKPERDDVLGGAQLPCDALHGAGGDRCGG